MVGRSPNISGGVGFFCLALSLLAVPARAQPVRHLRVVAVGVCPSAPDVTKELQRLFPSIDVAVAAGASAAGDAVVEERPDGFVVTLAEFSRYFDEPAQRCAERAQMAAVFIAIALDPPRFPAPQAEAPPPAAPPVTEPPSPAPLELEMGPSLQIAPGAETRSLPFGAGGGVRARWGRGLSVTAGAGVTVAPLRYAASDARAVWLPLDLGVRVTRAAGRWDGGGELSLVGAPVRISGVNLSPSWGAWRVEVGARVAAFARRWLTDRVAIFAGVHSLLWARPYTLRVGGVGEIGETPGFWLGAQAGVAIRIF